MHRICHFVTTVALSISASQTVYTAPLNSGSPEPMYGIPPTPESQVTMKNHGTHPFMKW